MERTLAGGVVRRLYLLVVRGGGGLVLRLHLVVRRERRGVTRSVIAAALLAPRPGGQRVRLMRLQRLLVESLLRGLLDDSLFRHDGEDSRERAVLLLGAFSRCVRVFGCKWVLVCGEWV